MHITLTWQYQNKVYARGGGGGTSIIFRYAYWVCAAREIPIFSPEFPFRSISFSQITKKSVPEHHHITFFGGFCRSGDHHFQNFFNFNPFIASHGRLSPNAKRSAAPRVSGRSGDSHFHAQNGSNSFRSPAFHAQNGSSSFRSPAFSSSKRLKLVPEPHIFTLDRELVPKPLPIFHFAAAHTYQNLGWVPPPPTGGGGGIYMTCIKIYIVIYHDDKLTISDLFSNWICTCHAWSFLSVLWAPWPHYNIRRSFCF